MAAPDFSKPTIEILSSRSALRCNNPDCDVLTTGPHTSEDKKLSIGEAAHIYGARPSERRYRATMTDTERATISNGIWLCRNCHGEIDKDPVRFPAELLLLWKADHERKILEQVGTKGDKLRQIVDAENLSPFSHLPPFIRQIIKDKPEFWEFILTAELLDHYCNPVIRHGNDLQRGLILKELKSIPSDQFLRWFSKKPNELLAVPIAIEGLIADLQKAWGAPGQPGDEHEIDHVCRLFAGVADHLVKIAEDTKFTFVPDGFEGARDLMTTGALYSLRRFSEFSGFFRDFIAKAPREGTFAYEFVVDLPESWAEDLEAELQQAYQAFEERGGLW